MTEGEATPTAPLNPLMQTWLDDVSNLLQQVNEQGVQLELRESFVPPEVVEGLNATIAALRTELAAKSQEVLRQQSAERILRDSVNELQQEALEAAAEIKTLGEHLTTANSKREEALALAAQTKVDCDATLAQQASDFAERDRQRDVVVQTAQNAARQLRTDLAKEKVEGMKRAEEKLRHEHALDIAKNHQIGKNKGIAIATAYTDSAKEENADLARASILASSVVIQSARRIESGLTIQDVSVAPESSVDTTVRGTGNENTLKMSEDTESEENNSRNFLRFSRKIR